MFAFLLFILFPILYKKNRTWYFLYGLLFFVIGSFVAYKIGLFYATIIHNVFYMGVLLPFISDKAYKKFFTPILLWALAYITYLVFLHVYHGNDLFRDLKDNFRVLFVFVFVVEVYENLRMNRIDVGYFVNVFMAVLIFEIILCWIQYFSHGFGNFFRITEYTWNGEVMLMTGNSDDYLDNNLCFGTLMGGSTVANYLTVSIMTFFLAKQKRGFQIYDYIFLAVGLITLLITGIRAPLLVLLVMLYFLLLRGKKLYLKIVYLVVGIAVTVLLIPILSSIGSQGGLNTLDNTVLRSLNIFTQIETGSVSEEGTLTYPLSMIPYIVQHPLIGNGLHYGSGYYMELNFRVLEDYSLSDAGIFFYWAEYGLVGLLVFYYFYYYLVKICSRYGFEKKDIRYLVIILFFLSIVDCSVINNYCTTVFALSPIIIMYYQRAQSTKNEFEKLTAKNKQIYK